VSAGGNNVIGKKHSGADAVISGQTLKIFDRTLSISGGSIDAEATTTIKAPWTLAGRPAAPFCRTLDSLLVLRG
jgi:hypothetical protein